MNIMEIVSNTGMNGAINHCLLLSRELLRRGNRVTLVCHPRAWIAKQVASDGIDVVPSDLHRWPPDELRRIAAIVAERRIDVVHTHASRAHFFGILLRWFAGVPSVATAHSCHFQLHWMFNDYVIACSEATRRYHRRYNLVRSSRIGTICNFIDLRRMSEVSPDARTSVRASLGIDDSCHLIGAVGDVIPRKGLIYLVGAMPKILAAVPQCRLLVVGNGDSQYADRARSSAEQLGVASAIIWADHRDDVHEVLASLEICVLPSLDEGLPLSILEAMAAGLPVVATTAGGIPECVGHGVTGLLVPPADSDALAEAIIGLLRDPTLRRKMGEAGRERVRQQFSPESQAPRIEGVLEHVARLRRAA